MKVRVGFVSNSSSSSFVIEKKHLSDLQIVFIKNHIETAKMLDKHLAFYEDDFEEGYKPESLLYDDYQENNDEWKIEEDDLIIEGSTWMDNFDIKRFIRLIGVDLKQVTWEDM